MMAKIDIIRQKAKDIFREYEIIYTLINGMTAYFKDEFEDTKKAIDTFDKRDLREFIERIKSAISDLRKLYGIKVDNSILVDFWDKVESLNWPAGKILYIHKYAIKDWFKKYSVTFPAFDNFPEHAQIGIDPGILRRKRGEGVNVFILEAVLFQDMCGLFNVAKTQYNSINIKKDSGIKWKTFCSILHATIIAGYNFLESYLNGLAIDFYIMNKDKLDEKTIRLLTDWDFESNRPRYISLRDKMLQYPRIILGLEHPPLQESNCAEMKFLIESKYRRDSIIHPSPNPDFGNQRTNDFLNPNFEEVVNIIDNIILFVFKLKELIRGNHNSIDWFSQRTDDGLFPESVFK